MLPSSVCAKGAVTLSYAGDEMARSYYVFKSGRIRRKENTLYFEGADDSTKPIPIEDVDDLYFFGEIDLNTKLLNFLGQQGKNVHIFNYYGHYTGSFYPRERNVSGFLLLKQVEHYWDKAKRLFLAKELEVPLVSEYHGSRWISTRLYKGKSIPFEFISRRIERVNLESSSLISTVSSVLKRDLISFGINSEKIIVNRNCVDLDLFNPDVSPLIQKESGKIRIGFSGIFSKWYGLRTLLRALFSIRREYHGKVDFLLLGDGPLFDSVKKRVSGMREFLLPGWVDLPEVPRYLISCDILVSPNEPIGELRGSPVKIPEYMALGKAVVASRTGDIPEIIGDSGVLFTPGDYVDLRDKISYLIENEEERRKLGKRAWKRVRKNYTWEKYAERLMESIKKIGGGSGKE